MGMKLPTAKVDVYSLVYSSVGEERMSKRGAGDGATVELGVWEAHQ